MIPKANISVQRTKELHDAIREQERQLGQDLKSKLRGGKAQIRFPHETALDASGRVKATLYDELAESANLLPSLVPLRLVLTGVSKAEAACVSDAIREHFQAQMKDLLWDKHSNRTRMFWMTAIGLLLLSAYFILNVTLENPMFLEILSIIGSFSLWDAASCFFVIRREIDRQLLEAAQFLTMEVVEGA